MNPELKAILCCVDGCRHRDVIEASHGGSRGGVKNLSKSDIHLYLRIADIPTPHVHQFWGAGPAGGKIFFQV